MNGARIRAALACLALASPGLLRENAAAQPLAPLSYRRVYVPHDALEGQIRGLLPLKHDEFERRLALVAAQGAPGFSRAAVRIEQATFRAQLVADRLVEGRAELTVITEGAGPALLALEPCSLALDTATWQTGAGRAAVIGADSGGSLRCLVEESGTLSLAWSQAATAAAPGETTFELRLPFAPRRRLEIAAPSDVQLSTDAGLVTPLAEGAATSGHRLWTIELGGNALTRLQVRTDVAGEDRRPPLVAREATSYAVWGSAIDVETEFTLEALRQPLPQLELQVDPALQITAVHLGDQALPFSTATGPPDKFTTVVVPVDNVLAGPEAALAISATCQWTVGRPFVLPRMKLASGVMQEGRVDVNAPAWMWLRAHAQGGCIQTQASSASAGRSSDRFEFQLFESDAAIEISSGPASAPLYEQTGTQITIEGSQITGVLVAELTSLGAGQFAVQADVPRQWIIDSVETQPADMLVDRALTARGSGPHHLLVKLARPMTSQRPLRLIVRGHYRRPGNGQPLDDDFFRLARFTQARDGRRLVAMRVNEPSAELRLLEDDHLVRLDPARLTPAETKLFESPPGPLLFERRADSPAWRAVLQAATPHYQAEIMVRADVTQAGMEQSISVRCHPESSAVGSLLVRLAPRPSGDVAWRLAGDEGRELLAVLESQLPATGSSDAAVYRLLLPRSQNSPFEVKAQWSQPQAAGDEVTLAWLPEAHRHTGFVEVHSTDTGLLVQTSQVQALPRPPNLDDRFTTLRGRYRYEAGRRARVSIESAPAGIGQRGAWVESLRLESRFSLSGDAEHEATFAIRNAGLDEFSMRLSRSAKDCRLVSDGGEEALPGAGAENEVRVPLPPSQRRAVVRVRYTTSGPLLDGWPTGKVGVPVPQPDLPVLGQSWSVCLPPGLAPVERRQIQLAANEVPGPDHAPKTPLQILAGPKLATQLSWFAPQDMESSSNAAFRGWSVLELDLPRAAEASLAVYRPAMSGAWSLGLALAGAALVLRRQRAAGWAGPCIVLLAAMAIANEPPFSWLAGGACLGLLVGGCLQLFRRQPIAAHIRTSHRPASSTILLPSGQSAGAIAFLLAVGLPRCLPSAPAGGQPAASATRARVVFPVDGDQQPSGDYVYLEPQFYEELHKLTDVRGADRPAWLVERARYELLSPPKPQHVRAAAVEELRMSLDIYTFESVAAVTLPMRRDQVSLLEGRARLDGNLVKLMWQADGRALSLPIESPGRHRLDLALGAVTQRAAEAMTLDLAVPQAAVSTVVLPRGPAGGQVISPAAESTLADGSRHFHLAATGHLQIRWPAVEATGSSAVRRDAEQLLWWKVRPGSVMVEGRFVLRSGGAPLREATIAVDPRLRLLPASASGPIGRVRVEPGGNLVRVELADPAASEVQFRLAWLWPDAAGIGKLLLPGVTIVGDRLSRDWAAVSVEPGLEISRPPAAGQAPSPEQFAQAWGDASSIAPVVFGGLGPEQQRAVVVRPTIARPQAEQTVDWSVSSERAQAQCTIELAGVAPSRFENRVSLPAQLKVSRAALWQGGHAAAIRWVQQPDGAVVVTLLEPPAAEQSLRLTAEAAISNNRPQFRLPQIKIADVASHSEHLRIYRHHDVQLAIQRSSGWISHNGPEVGTHRAGLGRLATELTSGADDGIQPLVIRSANRAKLAGKMCIRAHQADGDWRCEVNLDLQIADGALDDLRLLIPDEWAGPLEMEPAMEQRVETVPGETRKQLTIRPLQAMKGRLELVIRGPLHIGAAGVQAPEVVLLGGEEIERFVLLDRGSPAERIDWQTTGLLAAGAGAAAALPVAWRDVGGDLYRVIGPRFDATARARQTTAAVPRVHLADLRATVYPGRRLGVVALFTIQPAGARDVVFAMPPGCRLIQALVDGIATPCVASGPRTWTLATPSEILPFRLTIVLDSYVPIGPDAFARLHLQGPQLIGIQAQQSLWSVRFEANERAPQITEPVTSLNPLGHPLQPCDLWQAEFTRLESGLQSLEDVVAAQGSNLPASVVAESYVRWRRALNDTRQRLLDMLNRGGTPAAAGEQMQRAIESAAKVQQRLLQAGILDGEEDLAPRSGTVDDDRGAALHLLTPGGAEDVELAWAHSGAEFSLTPTAAALCFVLAAVVAWLASRLAAVQEWAARYCCFLVALGAFGWWLLAPLGWLAWPVALLAIWLSIRSPWPRLAYDAATVHRATNSSLR